MTAPETHAQWYRQQERLLELAKKIACHRHTHAVSFADVNGGADGHVSAFSDYWGFDSCPHPDCVLVREAAHYGNLALDLEAGSAGLAAPPPLLGRSRPEEESSPLTFETFRNTNVLRCETAFHKVDEWKPWDWSNAMAGEGGEVAEETLALVAALGRACNLTKKMNRVWPASQFIKNWNKPEDQRIEELAERLAGEIGDVVIYADLLAASIGRNLEDCVRDSFNSKSDELGIAIKLPSSASIGGAPHAKPAQTWTAEELAEVKARGKTRYERMNAGRPPTEPAMPVVDALEKSVAVAASYVHALRVDASGENGRMDAGAMYVLADILTRVPQQVLALRGSCASLTAEIAEVREVLDWQLQQTTAANAQKVELRAKLKQLKRHTGRCHKCEKYTCGFCGSHDEHGKWWCEVCAGNGPYGIAIARAEAAECAQARLLEGLQAKIAEWNTRGVASKNWADELAALVATSLIETAKDEDVSRVDVARLPEGQDLPRRATGDESSS